MDISPLASANQPIPIHATLATFSVVVGGLQFCLPKGTLAHRALGYLWVVAILIVSISSFLINELRWIGPFGPIHILSCLMLWTLWHAVHHARNHAIDLHRRAMVQLYFYNFLAGAFTLMPGRIMYQVFFG